MASFMHCGCPCRISLLQFGDATLQSAGIELIDGEHADATLGASGTAYQPWAAAACGIRQGCVYDLNKLSIAGW
jgi:hypothetical protein